MFSPDVHLALVVFHDASTPKNINMLVDDWNETMGALCWKGDIQGAARDQTFAVNGKTLACTVHTGTQIEGLSTLSKISEWMEARAQFVKGVAFAVVASSNPAVVDQEDNKVSMWGQDAGSVSFVETLRPRHTVNFKQRLQKTLNLHKPYDGAALLDEVVPTILQLPALQRVRGIVWSHLLNESLPGEDASTPPPVRKPRM